MNDDLKDNHLVVGARDSTNMSTLEVMLRLRMSIDNLSRTTERYSRVLIGLAALLVLMTGALIGFMLAFLTGGE